MKKTILAFGIIVLFILSALTPTSIGYDVKTSNDKKPQSTSSNGLMDNDWPMYQHDEKNTGFSPSPFPDSLNLSYNLTYLEILNFSFASFQSLPIVANGKIFICGWGSEADVIAIDENNLSLIWKKKLPLNDSSTPFGFINNPVVSNGKIFVCFGSMFSFPPQSKIYALDENTGEIIWENHFFTSSTYPSITISNDKVIVGGHFTNFLPISRLYVFDANNGDSIWRKTMLGYFESTPAVSNNTVFIATSCKSPVTLTLGSAPLFSGRARVYAFNLKDGSIKWNTRINGHIIISSPTVSNGKLLIPSTINFGLSIYNRRITALDVETGEEIWHYLKEGNALNSAWPTCISTPSVAYGKIFINDASGFIIALDEATGEMLWESEIIEEVESASTCSAVPPVIADYKVITTSLETDTSSVKSEICTFNVTNGDKIWSVEYDYKDVFIMAPFALANGKLIINGGLRIYVYS
jgi:outer membrane protein assembly factor BamB